MAAPSHSTPAGILLHCNTTATISALNGSSVSKVRRTPTGRGFSI